MCARYFINIDIETIKEIFDAIEKRYPGIVMSRGEVYPTDTVPILTKDGPAPSIWGFKGPGAGIRVINARSETAQEKRMFRDAFRYGRCVVPTNGFYEWTKTKQKIKYLFEMPDEQLLYLAGLYEEVGNETCMVVLTRAANESVSDVHDRMPVILTGDQLTLWLNETDQAREIIEMAAPRLVRRDVDATARELRAKEAAQISFDFGNGER